MEIPVSGSSRLPERGSQQGPREPWGRLTALVEQIDAVRHLDDAAALVTGFALARFDVDAAGISTTGPHGSRVRLAATDDLVLRLDAELARPPDLTTERPENGVTDAIADGVLVVVDDTLGDNPWPDWGRRAAEHQLRSIVLAGMPLLRERPVVLELYSYRPRSFLAADEHDVLVLAKHAGLALRHVDRFANLQEAVSTRALIGQAQGIVMERYHLTSEQAMAYLRRTSQESQQKVRDLAEHMVGERDRTQRPTRDDDAPGTSRTAGAP